MLKVRQIIAQSAKEVSNRLPFAGLLALAARERREKLTHEWQAWSAALTAGKRHVPTLDQILVHSFERGAQAWMAIHHALCVDADVSYPMADEYSYEIVARLALLDLNGLMVKWVKETSCYCACRGFAQAETNEGSLTALNEKLRKLGLDPLALGQFAAGGWVKRLCKYVMAPRRLGHGAFTRRILCLAQNVLNIKRGLPAMEPWDVAAATEAHKVALSSLHPDKEDDRHVAASDRSLVELALTNLIPEVFKGAVGRFKLVLPTLSACYERASMNGGALCDLARRCGAAAERSERVFSGMKECPLNGKVYEVHLDLASKAAFDSFHRKVADKAIADKRRPVDVLPFGICEPAKVRMITMGESVRYEFAQSIQKLIWGEIKKHPIFQWVGKPITQEDFTSSFPPAKCMQLLEDGWQLVSGDYSAATDNLNPRLSATAWSLICDFVQTEEGVPLTKTPWYGIGMDCLVNHQLHHGGTRKDPGDGVKQQWGQLMGSPISFPILNLVNAAAAAVGLGWRGPEEDGDVAAYLKTFCVRTNGDDIVFICPPGQYGRWKEVVTHVGLEPSLGKNYASGTFLIMNSECRMLMRAAPGDLPKVDPVSLPDMCEFCSNINPRRDQGKTWPCGDWEVPTAAPAAVQETDTYEWRFVPFLNLAILFGLEAKGPKAGQLVLDRLPYYGVGSLARALVRECSESEAKLRLQVFVEFYREVLERAPAGVIWDAPESLGGLGIPAYRPFVAPDGALRRCAWLSCLETLQRLKEVTPPPVKAVLPWLEALKHASEPEHSVEFVSDLTFFSKDHLPPRLLTSTTKDGGRGLTVANFLRDWSPGKKGYEELESLCHDKAGNVVDPKWRLLQEGDAVEVEARKQSEQAYSARIWKQLRKSAATSLSPMSESTLRSWTDHRVIGVWEADASIDTTADLFSAADRAGGVVLASTLSDILGPPQVPAVPRAAFHVDLEGLERYALSARAAMGTVFTFH